MKLKIIASQISATILITSALMLGGCTITDIISSTSSSLDTVTPDVTLNRFVDTRIAAIQQEAAQGAGENLDALAYMLGQEDSAEFAGWMQVHYTELFSGLEQPKELLTRIEATQAKSRS